MSDELQDPTNKLVCFRCLWPYDSPIQYSCCGLRLCSQCFEPIKDTCVCPKCGKSGMKTRQDKGFLRDFENQQIHCPLCENTWSGPYKDLKNHLKKCHCTVNCRNCQENFVSREQLKLHQLYRCTTRVEQCLLCDEEIDSNDLGKHFSEVKHQEYLLSVVKNILLTKNSQSTRNRNNAQVQQFQTECLAKIKPAIEQADLTKQQLVTLNANKQSIETKINSLWNKFKDCNHGATRVHELFISIMKIMSEMEKDIEELKRKSITGPKLLDANDAYIWRVNLLVLLNGELCTINSEKFQTSEWGYRIGICVTIESDEHNRDRFISISFMIFAGDYDQILQWPFSYPVTFVLMNVEGEQKHISSRIEPNHRKNIFGKPTGDVNEPFKISRFCSVQKFLDNAKDFIYEDHSFLKVHIDFTS